MRRRSFQARLLFLIVCALVLFEAGTLIAVHVAGQRNLRQTLADELRVGARVLNRILEARGRQLTDAARVLAADFAFREAIASGDRPTITSALTNLGARVDGHAVFLITLDGTVDADTLGGQFVGRPFPVPSLVTRTGSPAEATAIVTLDNRPFQYVVVPVLAPQPIAWVCIGFTIGRAELEDVRRLTALELSLWASNPGEPPFLISTLPQEEQLALREQIRDESATPETLQLGPDTYQTLLQPIDTGDGSSINVLLQRSLEEARRPLRRLELQIFALSSAALFLAIVAAIFFARGVTSPLRRLAEAAQRIGSGDYSTAVEIPQDDEMGQLAVAFNRMGAEISAREIERTRAEEALRTAVEQYRLLFDSNPHPMWVYEQETFAFLAVNDAALRHYGYTRDEFLAMTVLDIRPPEEIPAFESEYAAHRADHGGAPFYSAHPVKHRKKDGSVVEVDIAASSIVFGGRAARLLLATDVTEKKSLEAQLVRAQKMEAVGQLAGGVAHDFNNLLGVITGNTELLMRDLPPASRERKRGEEIKRATDRAAALIRQLLAFGRRQFLQPKVLDLNAIVAEVEKMLQRLISASIAIVTVPAANLGKVRADAGQIEQVLMNLAINARDAMPSGGRLVIETGNVEVDERYTRTNPEARPGPHVMLAVSDTGHGMDAQTMTRIFEPFFTTKEEGKGTGLGLATVYGIVRQSGGTVNVYSEVGRGTTFKVYLPRVEAEVETEARADSTVPPGGKETILLVEDAEALRLLVRELLESAGYTVLDAEAPDKAIALILSTPGPIDLVLTDMVMPGMSGLELAKRVATLKPEARVVFMSGYSDQAMGDQGSLEPGTLFLQKPFTMDALMRTVRGALDTAS